MTTPHNEANLGDIAKTVIMPGDPLRAKYIAENFLENSKLVNQIRNMYAYTGIYKGKEVTIMASGMGMPSMGIYSYELYKFYEVENIIRIGSCGAYCPNIKLFDIILSNASFSEGNFALTFNNEDCHIAKSSEELNKKIIDTANETNISLVQGNTTCMDFFDLYATDITQFFNRIPNDFNPISAEMEAFALFYVSKVLNKKSACLMSVVDIVNNDGNSTSSITAQERQNGLNKMIKLALDSSLKI